MIYYISSRSFFKNSMAAVRLLLRRTGIRRPAPRRELLLEVEEVFRVDVIAAAFENRFPALRVIFRITQPEEAQDLEEDFPLELPEENFRPGRAPLVHCCREPARGIWRTLFQGDPTGFPDPDLLIDLVDVYGPGPGALCHVHLPEGSDGDKVWQVPELLANHELIQHDDDLDYALANELIDWFIDVWPSHALVALRYWDDTIALMHLRNYVQDPRNHHYPTIICGVNEQLHIL